MSIPRNDLALRGCRPTPLAGYLKSLGILRLVSEQSDDSASGYWSEDVFHLVSRLSESELLSFFRDAYEPTPIIAPWNAGSGFYLGEEKRNEKDPVTGKKVKTGMRNQETAATRVVESILSSSCERLRDYRAVIGLAKAQLLDLGLSSPPEEDAKARLLLRLRSALPDELVTWLDAAVVLTPSGPKYPPILGTGGNDGRLDFTSNFMQRIIEIMDGRTGISIPFASNWLSGSIIGKPIRGLSGDVVIGQFFPSAAGGANASAGFDSDPLVNPWDFILMIEGVLFFAASSSRRLGNPSESGGLSSPFTVRPVGCGYESASSEDAFQRPEMWLPLWGRPVTAKELGVLMSEGRARVGRRSAESAVDFARAVASLGVDRGIDSFQRYAFQLRNGRTYFALPLGRYDVRARPEVELLKEVDEWLLNFRRKASSDKAPKSVASALHRLDDSIMGMCRQGGHASVLAVMESLGGCERAILRSRKWTKESFIPPIPPLSPSWLTASYDGTCEYRLAASIASVHSNLHEGGHVRYYPLRSNLEPIMIARTKETRTTYVKWLKNDSRDVAWLEGNLVSSMNSIMTRRIMRAVQAGEGSYPDRGRPNASLSDVESFLEGRTNDQLIADLLWGLMLVDWSVPSSPLEKPSPGDGYCPPAVYGLLKLCFSGSNPKSGEIPITPDIHRRAMVGNGRMATVLASRRLRGSDVPVALEEVDANPILSRRVAAALMIPLSERDLSRLAEGLLLRGTENEV